MNQTVIDYLNPDLPANLKRLEIPRIIATAESLGGYGQLVREEPEQFPIEIVRWPAAGWRPVDPDCGDEGGTRQGVFHSEWKGDILYGKNEAVGGHYVLGYACTPELADDMHDRDPAEVLLWHANYHPDGGQLFFPLDRRPFIVPLVLWHRQFLGLCRFLEKVILRESKEGSYAEEVYCASVNDRARDVGGSS